MIRRKPIHAYYFLFSGLYQARTGYLSKEVNYHWFSCDRWRPKGTWHVWGRSERCLGLIACVSFARLTSSPLLHIFTTPSLFRFLLVSFFRTPSQFRSPLVSFWKRLLRTLTKWGESLCCDVLIRLVRTLDLEKKTLKSITLLF